MKNSYDVVIVGGGMVGATLACALGGSALRVAVIEPQAPPETTNKYGLRVSAITPASQAVFEKLGAWSGMRAAPVEAMRVWEGDSVLNFDSADIGAPCLAWIIENRTMVAALTARLRQFANLEVLSPASVATAQFGEERVSVQLEDGRVLQTKLLVGADGADSRIRRAAGIDWMRHDLGQSAVVAVVRTERPHARTACQHFLPTGPLAFLPLDEPHTVSIVWSADAARAAELMRCDDAAFNNELQLAFGDSLGAVSVASARAVFPLALGFAQTYTQHRLALVGDAAHTVHPLAGQGVNLGIQDAWTLAAITLDAHGRGRDFGARAWLRRYERARKGEDVGMQLVTGGFRYLFGSAWPGAQLLRTASLRVTEQLPLLKHFFMRQASGPSG